MTDLPLSAACNDGAAVVLAKVHVARNLVDGARWSLLDAVIELEATLKQLGFAVPDPGVPGNSPEEPGPHGETPLW